MLKRLYISNFALINEMDVSFPGHLSVVTGETGAGKSIFLEALGLALGKRVDLGAVKNKNKKCIVEAEFDTSGLDLISFFEENDLDFERNIILRREINAEGKSRSFLNDSIVSLAVLKSLSEKLIDIHSQHQSMLINQSNFQLEVVDALAGSLEAYKAYKTEFLKLNRLEKILQTLIEQEVLAKKELDYNRFLLDELSEVDLRSGILEELEQQSEAIENAEAIKNSLLSASTLISGGELNSLSGLAQIKQTLNSISKYKSEYEQYFERLNSAYIELKELATDLTDAGENIQVSGAALAEVNAKLDKLNRLLNKHSVKSTEELLTIKSDTELKLQRYQSLESETEKTKKQVGELKKICLNKAKELSDLRKKALAKIEMQVVEMLKDLSMENANFKIEHLQLTELNSGGMDSLKFMFSANKGVALNELQKVASGGELSRLMLSLKAIMATKKQLPTIIFDEIDTGVSGDVANKIGEILLKMGKSLQVVAITHLPQMASKGEHHLFVYKRDDEDKTNSYIRELNAEERITEIAKMLSTSKPTISALKNAKELLSINEG